MKRQFLLVYLLVGLMLLLAGYKASRPEAGLLKFQAKGELAYGYGYTDSRSLEMVKGFLKDHPEVRTLVLKKMPGTVDSEVNTRLARLIRKRGLNTHLDKNSFIASGAVDLFIAGVERTMECGAAIGVHSWAYTAPEGALLEGRPIHPGNMGSDPHKKRHEKFLSDMGVDPGFYVFTREAALPQSMYFMRAGEIEKWGLLTEPANCQ